MKAEVLFLAHFSVLLLSIISFVEILVVFKGALLLKRIILGISFCFVLSSLIAIAQPYTGYMRGLSEMPYALLASLSILLMSFFSHQKIKKIAIVVCLLIIIAPIFIFIKLYFIDKVNTIIPTNSPILLEGSRYLLKVVFFTSGVVLLNWMYFIQFLRKSNQSNINFKQLRTWGYWYIVFMSLIWCINQLFILQIIPKEWFLVSITVCHFCLILVIIFRPKFLNHYSVDNFTDWKSVEFDIKFKQEDFIQLFFDKQYFLDKNADLDGFCFQNNILQADVNNIIYQFYSMNFLELVYKARIDYFVDLVKSRNHTTLTIDGLAKMSGFNSRQHLYKWFKKFHGGSPSDML
jgi:AraC-like DNA-binding protein